MEDESQLEGIPSPIYSDQFNAEDADVTYESSDGTRFRIHAIYLKVHSEGLAPPQQSTLEEVVNLSEPAFILEILFRFIYPIRQPILETMDFELVAQLAEAAEKYQIFPAMYACFLKMRSTLPQNAVSVLAYALKHDYEVLANDAAPYVLDEPPRQVIGTIPSEFYGTWLDYYDKWRTVQRNALTTHLPTGKTPYRGTAIRIAESLGVLSHNFETLFLERHSVWTPGFTKWKDSIRDDISNVPALMNSIERPGSTRNDGDLPTRMYRDGDEEMKSSLVLFSLRRPKGAKFHINSRVLRLCAPGFEEVLNSGAEDAIGLPEDIPTIRLLLNFISPVRIPDLEAVSFAQLNSLARAAEKYLVYQAMEICRFCMKKALAKETTSVFGYASTFGYTDLSDMAAPLAIFQPFHEVVAALPSHLCPAWAIYHKNWQEICRYAADKIQEKAQVFISTGYNSGVCNCGLRFKEAHVIPVLNCLIDGPRSLRLLDSLLPNGTGCSDANSAFAEIRAGIEERIRAIPLFSTLT